MWMSLKLATFKLNQTMSRFSCFWWTMEHLKTKPQIQRSQTSNQTSDILSSQQKQINLPPMSRIFKYNQFYWTYPALYSKLSAKLYSMSMKCIHIRSYICNFISILHWSIELWQNMNMRSSLTVEWYTQLRHANGYAAIYHLNEFWWWPLLWKSVLLVPLIAAYMTPSLINTCPQRE